MATRRKLFVPRERARKAERLYAAFVAALLHGTIQAIKLIEGQDAKGRVRFTYDDPNG